MVAIAAALPATGVGALWGAAICALVVAVIVTWGANVGVIATVALVPVICAIGVVGAGAVPWIACARWLGLAGWLACRVGANAAGGAFGRAVAANDHDEDQQDRQHNDDRRRRHLDFAGERGEYHLRRKRAYWRCHLTLSFRLSLYSIPL